MDFSLPAWMWVGFGLFLGGLLFSSRIRSEVDMFLAHLMGMKPKNRGRKE